MNILEKVVSGTATSVVKNVSEMSKSLNVRAISAALVVGVLAMSANPTFARETSSEKAKSILGATAVVAGVQAIFGGDTYNIVKSGVSSATSTVLTDEIKDTSGRAKRIYNEGIQSISTTIGTVAGNAVSNEEVEEGTPRKRRSNGVSVGVSGQGDGVKVGAKYDKKVNTLKTKTPQVAVAVTAEEFAQAKQLLSGRDIYKTIENCENAFNKSSDPKGLALIKLVAADAASTIPDQKIRNQYVATIQNGWNKSPSVGMN